MFNIKDTPPLYLRKKKEPARPMVDSLNRDRDLVCIHLHFQVPAPGLSVPLDLTDSAMSILSNVSTASQYNSAANPSNALSVCEAPKTPCYACTALMTTIMLSAIWPIVTASSRSLIKEMGLLLRWRLRQRLRRRRSHRIPLTRDFAKPRNDFTEVARHEAFSIVAVVAAVVAYKVVRQLVAQDHPPVDECRAVFVHAAASELLFVQLLEIIVVAEYAAVAIEGNGLAIELVENVEDLGIETEHVSNIFQQRGKGLESAGMPRQE